MDDDTQILDSGTNLPQTSKSSQKNNASLQSEIPIETRNSITDNCIEVNMIPIFSAEFDLKSKSRIGAIIGINIDKLTNITPEQKEVWGLTQEYRYICLKFEFKPRYLNEGESPKIRVGCTKNLSPEENLKAFRLSWTIEDRIKNNILSTDKWPSNIDMKSIPNAKYINNLMESTQQEYGVVVEALKYIKDVKKSSVDIDAAMNYLIDDKMCKKFTSELPSIEKCAELMNEVLGDIVIKNDDGKKKNDDKKKNDNEWKQDYENVDDEKKIKQLMEMFHIPLNVAKLALQLHGYDTACKKLANNTTKQEIVEAAIVQESLKDKDKDKNNNNNNNNDDDDDDNKNKKDKDNKSMTQFITSNFVSNNNNNNKKGKGFIGSIMDKISNKKNDNDGDAEDEKQNDNKLDNKMVLLKRHLSDNTTIQIVKDEHMIRTLSLMLRHNFLLRCLCYSLKVLLNGNKKCMICDTPLDFVGLKPSICSNSFCQFRHDSMGLGFSLSAEVTHRPEVTDLLISMCYASCLTKRVEIFFPSSVRGLDPEDEDKSFLREDGKTNDVAKLLEALELCPSIEDMTPWAKKGDIELKKQLKAIHVLLYPLLAWIMTSNRSHLRILKKDELINDMKTPYQFALCSMTPEKEAQFQRNQRDYGSFLAFHGSGMGNWHSILRMGLKNYSQTQFQLNGAAYGNGIYLGGTSSISLGYCGSALNSSWKKSMYGSSISCMALCEVVYHPENSRGAVKGKKIEEKEKDTTKSSSHWNAITDPNNKWVKTSGIFVVDKEEHVTTRFFLIFKSDANSHPANVDAKAIKIPSVVNRNDNNLS